MKTRQLTFPEWLDQFVADKHYDPTHVYVGGADPITLATVIDALKHAPRHEQLAVQKGAMTLDCFRTDCLGFFGCVAAAMAKKRGE